MRSFFLICAQVVGTRLAPDRHRVLAGVAKGAMVAVGAVEMVVGERVAAVAVTEAVMAGVVVAAAAAAERTAR